MASRLSSLAPVSLALAVTTTSCAAMFDGTKSTVMFQSTPLDAEVEVDGQTYKTPVAVEVIKKTKSCTLRHADFGDQRVTIEWKRTTQSGFVLMDILLTPGFGLSGLVIDGASGAFYERPATVSYDFTTRVAMPDTCKVKHDDLANGPQANKGGAIEASAPKP